MARSQPTAGAKPRTERTWSGFDYAGGLAVTIAHMHGLRDLAGKQDTPGDMPRRSAGEADRLGCPQGRAAVVCGDFNAPVEPNADELASA